MAGIPVHTESPISPHAKTKPPPLSPSASSVRYTPEGIEPSSPSSTPPRSPWSRPIPATPSAAGVAGSSDGLAQHSRAFDVTHQRKHSTPVSPRTSYALPASTYSPVHLPENPPSPHLLSPVHATASPSGFPQDLSHPPGYQQDSRASFEDRPFATEQNEQPFNLNRSKSMNRRSVGAGILNGEIFNDERTGGFEDKTVWENAMDWAKFAGKKLTETEEQVWKKVNGDR